MAALVEPPARIGGHGFQFAGAAEGAGEQGFEHRFEIRHVHDALDEFIGSIQAVHRPALEYQIPASQSLNLSPMPVV